VQSACLSAEESDVMVSLPQMLLALKRTSTKLTSCAERIHSARRKKEKCDADGLVIGKSKRVFAILLIHIYVIMYVFIFVLIML
jgi:hypothetical protein